MASHHGAFSAAPVGRARPSTFDLNTSSASVTSASGDAATADLLREQQIERDRLQMDNFNLMMRVAVLEERLANTQSTFTEDFEAELLQKRVEIEEKDAKIRQQKDQMLRAVEAIEQLKRQLADALAEIERARAQSNRGEEMEVMRQMLAKTEAEAEHRGQRLLEAETQLAKISEERAAFRARSDESLEMKQRMEAEVKQLRQRLQQLDQQQTKGVMQVEHLQSVSKQRQEQLQDLSARLDQANQEKQQLEGKYQLQLKRMEDQMRGQLEKQQEEVNKYRNEFMKVNTERDKLQFERERFLLEVETVKKDKARYQAEWERMAKDLERLTTEVEALRLQNVKLSATCEHQASSIESYKNDRENALDNMHKLEGEVNEWRKRSSEQEVSAKSLEVRCRNAETEVARLQEKLEDVTARSRQSANDRVMSLEQGKNALEAQNYELRMSVSSLQRELESLTARCQSSELQLRDEAEKVKEYKDRLVATERELRQHSGHAQRLEHELAGLRNSSMSEGARAQQYSDQLTRTTNERNQLAESLAAERSRLESAQKSLASLESENQQLTKQFTALANEIRAIVDFGDHELSYRSLDALLKEARTSLQRNFKAESDMVIRRWHEHFEQTRGEIDQLSSRLHSCHAKIESLQRATLSAHSDTQSIQRSWERKYENLRNDFVATRQSLEELLHAEKTKNAQLETSLAQVRGELDFVTQSRNGSINDLERDIMDLKESNRLLLGELQERRRSAEHARKQYLAAVAENKDLLSAVDILKNGIVERDKQIEYFKATILRITQQLQRGSSMGEVKQKLLEQLEQTQFMVNETYKKWSHSDVMAGINGFHSEISNNATNSESLQWVERLEEHVGRLEVVCDRWHEYIQQSRDMQRRYGEAWRSAAISFGKGKERPSWVDEIERKCSRLLTESVRVSEAMRDVVEDVVNALQHARITGERKHRRSRTNEHTRRRSTREQLDLSPLRENNRNDDALSLAHFHGDFHGGGDMDGTSEVMFVNRGKRVSTAPSRGGESSRTSGSRGAASAVYGHSLASLGRIGDELKIIEKKIKTYPDE